MTSLDIYQAYPRRVARIDAIKAIEKALQRIASGKDGEPPCSPSDAKERLLRAVTAYSEACRGKDPQFIPHPATWFNRGSYMDEPEAKKTTIRLSKERDAGLRVMQELDAARTLWLKEREERPN